MKTQHLLGAVVFTKGQDDLAPGDWQIQATHKRQVSSSTEAWWTGHSYDKHHYQRINNTWLLAGIWPHTILYFKGNREDVIGHFEQ